MNNRMTKNTYVSTTETERQTKQIKRIETESWIERAFGWLPDGRQVWGKE